MGYYVNSSYGGSISRLSIERLLRQVFGCVRIKNRARRSVQRTEARRRRAFCRAVLRTLNPNKEVESLKWIVRRTSVFETGTFLYPVALNLIRTLFGFGDIPCQAA